MNKHISLLMYGIKSVLSRIDKSRKKEKAIYEYPFFSLSIFTYLPLLITQIDLPLIIMNCSKVIQKLSATQTAEGSRLLILLMLQKFTLVIVE